MAGVAQARALVQRACLWCRSHPGDWARLRAVCDRMDREGYPIQRDSVYTVAGQLGIRIQDDEFRRDHNLWSVLARLMAMLQPSLVGSISFRRTPVDDVDLAASYEALVGPAPFVARSLAEARAVWEARGARRA